MRRFDSRHLRYVAPFIIVAMCLQSVQAAEELPHARKKTFATGARSTTPLTQRAALLHLAKLCGAMKVLGWDTKKHECTWRGVACNHEGRVAVIDWGHLGLTCILYDGLLDSLQYLSKLVFPGNTIKFLPNLGPSTAPRLEELHLSGTNMTGEVSFADFARHGTFPNLRTLMIADNQLTGALPEDWPAIFPRLEVLHMEGNNFTGPIPTSWAHPRGFSARSMTAIVFRYDEAFKHDGIDNPGLCGPVPRWALPRSAIVNGAFPCTPPRALMDMCPDTPSWWYVNAVGVAGLIAGLLLPIVLACIKRAGRAVCRRYSNWQNNRNQYIQVANQVGQV